MCSSEKVNRTNERETDAPSIYASACAHLTHHSYGEGAVEEFVCQHLPARCVPCVSVAVQAVDEGRARGCPDGPAIPRAAQQGAYAK